MYIFLTNCHNIVGNGPTLPGAIWNNVLTIAYLKVSNMPCGVKESSNWLSNPALSLQFSLSSSSHKSANFSMEEMADIVNLNEVGRELQNPLGEY